MQLLVYLMNYLNLENENIDAVDNCFPVIQHMLFEIEYLKKMGW